MICAHVGLPAALQWHLKPVGGYSPPREVLVDPILASEHPKLTRHLDDAVDQVKGAKRPIVPAREGRVIRCVAANVRLSGLAIPALGRLYFSSHVVETKMD